MWWWWLWWCEHVPHAVLCVTALAQVVQLSDTCMSAAKEIRELRSEAASLKRQVLEKDRESRRLQAEAEEVQAALKNEALALASRPHVEIRVKAASPASYKQVTADGGSPLHVADMSPNPERRRSASPSSPSSDHRRARDHHDAADDAVAHLHKATAVAPRTRSPYAARAQPPREVPLDDAAASDSDPM